MSVLRRAYVEVEPDVTGFDTSLREKFERLNPGGKAGRQLGGQLNQALKRLDLTPINVKANPASALANLDQVQRKLVALSNNASTVEIKVQAERGLAEINRFRKQLGDAGDDGAKGFFARFSGRLGPLMAAIPLNGPVGIAAAAAGAAAAPVLVSALASGLAAGAGAGVLGVGLAALAKDPAIAARGAEVGKRFVTALQYEANRALTGPALLGLDKLDAAGQRVAARLGQAFQKLAPELNPFISKLAQAGETLANSLIGVAEKSGPALDAVGDSVVLLSNGVSRFVNILADGGPEAASNLRLIAGATADVITQTAQMLNLFNKLSNNAWITGPLIPLLRKHYADTSDDTEKLTQSTTAADGSMRRLGSGTFGTASGVRAVGAAADEATAQVNPLYKAQETLAARMRTADAAARGERGALKGLSDQLRADIDPAFALINAQNTLKTAQDRAAEATRKHGSRSKEAKAATRELAVAALDLQGRAGELARGFSGKLTPQMMATFRAAGLTKGQIRNVEKQLIDAKKAADKYSGNYRANVYATGVPGVAGKLNALSELQSALKRGANPPARLRRYLGDSFAEGGYTGQGAKYEPAGVVHKGEFVFDADTVKKIERRAPGALEQIHETQRLPGYARGGMVWPFPVTASKTRIPSPTEASNAVVPAVPTGGRTDDWIERTAKMLVPGIRVLSKYRPGARTLSGNTSLHSMHRAVDFSPSHALAVKWNNRYKSKTKEFISPWNSLNIHNGQRHAYSGAIYRQHNFAGGNAHDHIAMRNGGTIREPVFGVGRSGRSYSFGENGPETVTPGAGVIHVHIHEGVVVTSKRHAEDLVVDAVKSARRGNRL